VVTSSQSQVATLMTQLGAMIDERPTVTEQQAQEIDSEVKHRADLAFAVSMVEDDTQILDAFEAFRRDHEAFRRDHAAFVSPGPWSVSLGPCTAGTMQRFAGTMQRCAGTMHRRGHAAFRRDHAPLEAFRRDHAPPGRAPRAGHYDRLILDHLDRRIFPSAHYSFP
jgi:hypothetical protein